MTDDLKLVERLRAVDHGSVEDCFLQSPLLEQAASAIERLVREAESVATREAATVKAAFRTQDDRDRLAKLVAEMREALEPFGRMADAYFHRHETRPGEFREAHQDKPNDVTVYGFNDASLTVGHLRRARALLQRTQEASDA